MPNCYWGLHSSLRLECAEVAELVDEEDLLRLDLNNSESAQKTDSRNWSSAFPDDAG